MNNARFWVVGGEYTSMDFEELAPGAAHVVGPFADVDEARRAWRELSEDRRCEALVRYAIAREPTAPERAKPALALEWA